MESFYDKGYLWAAEKEQQQQQQPQPGDHFFVDDLLDFSNDDDEVEEEEEEEAADAAADGSSSSTVTALDNSCCSNSFSGDLGHASISGELCDLQDLAELEWLSNFEEECFSTEDLEKLHLISGLKAAASQPSPAVFLPEAPVKARSKRSRAAPCSWSSRLLVLSPTPVTPPESELFLPELSPGPSPPRNFFAAKRTPKAAKKKESISSVGPSDGRRCLHCATDKTPQWRTGPMGPKTLCNACGVRYKSGRLVPEYRPAASPTFVLSKHSNSHRKVLELRRHKEMHPHPHLHHQSYFMPDNHGVYNPLAATAADEFLAQIPHHIGADFRQLI